MAIQSTTGFMDGIANYMGSLSELSLTKGTNLFAENFVDDPEVITDQLVLFDEGNEQLENFWNVHLKWNVRLLTTRKTRISAAEALRPILNTLIGKRTFSIKSDAGEGFRILNTKTIGSPEVTARTDTGRFAAQCLIQFQTIPE